MNFEAHHSSLLARWMSGVGLNRATRRALAACARTIMRRASRKRSKAQ